MTGRGSYTYRAYTHSLRRRRKTPAQGKGAKALAWGLIVTAGIAYVALASGIGRWIADEWIVPSLTQTPQPMQTEPEVQNSRAPAVKTQDITLQSLPYWAIQLGVFSEEESAAAEAAAVRQRGGAGYVLQQEGKYRVLAGAYTKKADAEQVKQQLSEQGVESYVLEQSGGQDVLLRVTGEETALKSVASACEGWSETVEKLLQIAGMLENGNAAWRDELEFLQADLQNRKDSISALAEQSAQMRAIHAYMENLGRHIAEALSMPQEDMVAISAKIKYIGLETAAAYEALLQELTGQP